MGAQEGYQCKIYLNTDTWDSPTWSEIDLTRDLTLNLARSEADLSSRAGSGFKQYLASLLDAGVDLELVWDTSNADFSAVLDAFLNNSTIELSIMDGDIETAGSEGMHADFVVTQCNRGEPLEGGVVANVTAKVAYSSNTPAWMTVAS